ncbi:MAG TPA: hypothetical protein VE975_08880 [Actinomycetota bacterium]|nr:hypothetical protein [Actinomycetota bacterium]
MYLYALIDGDGDPGSWWLKTGSGSRSESRRFDPGVQVTYPLLLGTEDVDGDGKDEVFVRPYLHFLHSGSLWTIQILRLDTGHARPVRTANGESFMPIVGGVSNFGYGLRCRRRAGRPVVILTQVYNAVSPRPLKVLKVMRFREGLLVPGPVRRTHITREGFSDPDVLDLYELNCGRVKKDPY